MEKNKNDTFLNRISSILNIPIFEVESLFSINRRSSFRINNLKVNDPYELLNQISKIADYSEISWCKDAYLIQRNRDKIVSSEIFRNGLITIQNASSFIPPLALSPSQNSCILDTCASPGIKSSHIASITNNKSLLVVNEAESSRVHKLEENLNLLCVSHKSLSIPAQFLNHRVENKFDYILVDAPCSGEGMISFNDKDPLRFWNLKKVHALAKLQKRILSSALDMLKVGGTLVYSTCTISPEENEGVIHSTLSKFPNVKTEKIDIEFENRKKPLSTWEGIEFDIGVSDALRVYPTEDMEAFFVCKMVKV
jgi:NOL1/NOP2/sun family putative RNA methylase